MKRSIAGRRCQLQKSSMNAPSPGSLARFASGESEAEVGVDRRRCHGNVFGVERAAHPHHAVAGEIAIDDPTHRSPPARIGMVTLRSSATSTARS